MQRSRWTLGLVAVAMTLAFVAADSYGKDQNRKRGKNRVRDCAVIGSQQDNQNITVESPTRRVAQFGKKQRKGDGDRKRDGSCQSVKSNDRNSQALGGGKNRKRKGDGGGSGNGDRHRKRDGSCQSVDHNNAATCPMGGDKNRNRKGDGSAPGSQKKKRQGAG